MKTITDTFKRSILAGMAIALGCTAFCSCDNKYVGAFLFSIGLCTICGKKWLLFTGALCKCQHKIQDLLFIYIGNFLGSAVVFFLCMPMKLIDTATKICSAKADKSLPEIFVAGILCEICIYIAVTAYRERQSPVGRYLGLILGVMVFIICGYEHCVADMFYALCYMNYDIVMAAIIVLTATCGNIIGACLMNSLDKQV